MSCWANGIVAPLTCITRPKKWASPSEADTPSMDPANAPAPFLLHPATRYMMTPVSTATVMKHTVEACHPARTSGMSSFQTARQLNMKLKSAFAPVQPPNAHRRTQNAAKNAKPQPIRQWSRATRISSSFAAGGRTTSAVSPTENFLSSSICALSSFAAANTRPSGSRTASFCVPNSTRPCSWRAVSSVSTTSALTVLSPSSARRRGPGATRSAAQQSASTATGRAFLIRRTPS